MFMLIFLIGFVLSLVIFIANRIVSRKNGNIKRFKLSRYLLFCNITLVLLFIFGAPAFGKVMLIPLAILLVINIITIVLVYNKKLINNKRIVVAIMIVYFLLVFFIPIYEFENHEHIFIKQHEEIRRYTEYHNCYLIRIFKIYE